MIDLERAKNGLVSSEKKPETRRREEGVREAWRGIETDWSVKKFINELADCMDPITIEVAESGMIYNTIIIKLVI